MVGEEVSCTATTLCISARMLNFEMNTRSMTFAIQLPFVNEYKPSDTSSLLAIPTL